MGESRRVGRLEGVREGGGPAATEILNFARAQKSDSRQRPLWAHRVAPFKRSHRELGYLARRDCLTCILTEQRWDE